jgi:hypothetical protein
MKEGNQVKSQLVSKSYLTKNGESIRTVLKLLDEMSELLGWQHPHLAHPGESKKKDDEGTFT